MTRFILKTLSLLAGIALPALFLPSAQARLAYAEPAETPSKSCQLLDVRFNPPRDDVFRIAIKLTEIPAYSVSKIQPNEPLRVELARTSAAPAFLSRFQANDLVRDFRFLSATGNLTLEFTLASPLVKLDKYEISSEGIIILNLQWKGANAPPTPAPFSSPSPTPAKPSPALAPSPEHETPSPQSIAHAPEKPASHPAEHTADTPTNATPTPALPPSAPSPSAPSPSPPLAAPPAHSMTESPVPAPSHTPAPRPRIAFKDNMKELTAPISFPRAEEMFYAFAKEADYMKAIQIGLSALIIPQPRKSMESLLYFLAESSFQLNKQRAASNSKPGPDWNSVQNFFHQAIRYTPDSSWRPMAEYRLSEIAGAMNNPEERMAELNILKAKFPEYGRMPEILLGIGKSALDIYENSSPAARENSPALKYMLENAQQALEQYLAQYPGDQDGVTHARAMLGHILCRQGDSQKGLALMESERGVPSDLPLTGELATLTAHKLKKMDLAHPRNDKESLRATQLRVSQNPDNRLEYARILEEGGAIKDALIQYSLIARGDVPNTNEDILSAAKIAMSRIARMDARENRPREDSIQDPFYRQPLDELKKKFETTYSLRPRAAILNEIVQHFIAQGRELEALQYALPYLNESTWSREVNSEIGKSLEAAIPAALSEARDKENSLVALQIFQTFLHYLKTHPRKDEMFLTIARILLNDGFREQAGQVMDEINNIPNLSSSQQAELNAMRQEARLDPSNPESVKREAPRMLEKCQDPFGRARILKVLAAAYTALKQNEYAAEQYLQAAAIKDLGWREHLDLQERATRQYNLAANAGKTLETAWQALRDFENTGVPVAEAEKPITYLLLLMAQNFKSLGDTAKAATAYEQYLQYFPNGKDAEEAKFQLARTYAELGRKKKAVELFDSLSSQTLKKSFWSGMAGAFSGEIRKQTPNTPAPDKEQ